MKELPESTQVLLESAAQIAKELQQLDLIKEFTGSKSYEKKLTNIAYFLEKEMDETLSLIEDWGEKYNHMKEPNHEL